MKWPWLVIAAALLAPPTRLQVKTARGTTMISLRQEPSSGPLVPLVPLSRAIGASVDTANGWAILNSPAGTFRLLIGTGVVTEGTRLHSLPAPTQIRRDTLYVPLAFVSEVLADTARRMWRWTRTGAILSEAAPVVAPAVATATRSPVVARKHRVTIDPGHGGIDSGNRGFANGAWESHVTLAVGLLVRDELQRQGVEVTMTRTRDTLINLLHRAPRYCRNDCDLFVSLHVNSLETTTPNYRAARGFETYFLSAARTEDAARVERTENNAVRFETPEIATKGFGNLDFLRRDLQTAAFLRQSERAASMIQGELGQVHDGTDRGVKQANLAVLTTALSPAVLVELGFSTNRTDATLMTTKPGQAKLASGIATAILAFLAWYDKDELAGGGP